MKLVLLAAVGALALSGCSLGGADNASGGLANTSWTVISIGGARTVLGAEPTMAFAPEGTVSGSGGCNQYTGPFRTEGDRITVGALSSTLMLCDGEVGAQEMAFTNALTGATTWRQAENGNLELTGMTDIIAEPAGPDGPPETIQPAELPGTSWVLTEMGGTADFADIVPTLEFGADGSVSGFAGCNSFSRSYTIDGSRLTMGPLLATKIGCERPASAVEAAYLEALAGVSSWTLAGDSLELGGSVAMRFRFAPG